MILSVSRRTDIPAYYTDWFFEQLRTGVCHVRNPRRTDRMTNIDLTPPAIDAIVFWTRDPRPLVDRLGELHELGFERYYFMITLTGYGPQWEPGGLPVTEAVAALKYLAKLIGPSRVAWRYDPIIITRCMDTEFHTCNFRTISEQLRGATDRVIVSLYDDYTHVRARVAAAVKASNDTLFDNHLEAAHFADMLQSMSSAAMDAGMSIQSCAESAPVFRANGIEPGACINPVLLNKLFDLRLPKRKDSGQRPDCLCGIARDIGEFNTCPRNCAYCYASRKKA